MDCTLLGATQNSHAKDSVHAPQLKENRLFALICSVVETHNWFCFCSATLHVLCLIRSKLHDLKRQRKERLGELLQVISSAWARAVRATCIPLQRLSIVEMTSCSGLDRHVGSSLCTR